MTREELFAVLLLGLLAITLSLPQQPKSKRPTPVFKVFRDVDIFVFLFVNRFSHGLSHTRFAIIEFPNQFFFSNLKLVACCYPTTQRSFVRTLSTHFRARTEFTVIMPTWKTSAKCFTCACRKREAQLDGVSFAPLRQFSTKYTNISSVTFDSTVLMYF